MEEPTVESRATSDKIQEKNKVAEAENQISKIINSLSLSVSFSFVNGR
jgi:hypothetical protein